jgi:DNA-directed RNA polymerase subunit beta
MASRRAKLGKQGREAFFVGKMNFGDPRPFHSGPEKSNTPRALKNQSSARPTVDGDFEHVYVLDQYAPTNQSTSRVHRPTVSEGQWVEQADLLADGAASRYGKVSLGKNILLAYLPWEGYNFEDAIVVSERVVHQDLFTSLHLEYYDVEVKLTQYGLEKITCDIPTEIDDPQRDALKMQHLNDRGVVRIGTWVEEGDYLVGKVTPRSPIGPSVDSQYEKLYHMIMQRDQAGVRNTSLRVPKGIEGFILNVQSLPPKEPEISVMAGESELSGEFLRVRITLLQRRRIQVGDKMAGRHGNKGVISTIVPIQDMPYLPDGTPVDIILNPLGVPSRMNVGQIFECLLGLAGVYLHESYQIELFDEQYGSEASRSLVYSKLYEASIQTSNPWLFEPHHPGKVKLFDGRSGEAFDQPITVGYAYMLKLVHQVVDKIHARATGPYSAITQQPVRGRSRHGGQRIGEMEVWALQAYGAAWTLQELLTIKSDDMDGRKETVFRLYSQQSLQYGQPESFKVLLRELIALALSINVYRPKNISQHVGLWKLEEYGL